jgi:predicted transcriptional regulator
MRRTDTTMLAARVPIALADRLARRAEAEDRSRSAVTRRALVAYLDSEVAAATPRQGAGRRGPASSAVKED